MNNMILNKCLKELEKESPNLDYIRGMIETLYLMGTETELNEAYMNTHGEYPSKVLVPAAQFKPATDPMDEGALLDSKAKGALASVKAMAEASTEMS